MLFRSLRRATFQHTTHPMATPFPRPQSKGFPIRSRLAGFLALVATCAGPAPAAGPTAATGTVTGTVSNAVTRTALEGAAVGLGESGHTTLTDRSGRFPLEDVPAGAQPVVITYTGLNPFRTTVAVAPGATANVTAELRSDVYLLDAYTVTGEREGNAASLTRQRNSANLRNVAAMDAFGNMPNDNVGEILMRLPGVAGFQTNDDTTNLIAIRGIAPDLNTFSVDGVPQANANGFRRGLRTTGASGALFRSEEHTSELQSH